MYQGYGQTEVLPIAMMRRTEATGDIGRLDANGYLYDMVISGAVRSRVCEGRSVSH